MWFIYFTDFLKTTVQQQPLLTQQMTVQSVALSQPALTTTHLAAQNQIGQVQITPAIQSHQVQIPLNQAHLLLNQQLTPAFGQVQINQAQLANIATSQHQATTHQTYFTPSISLQQVSHTTLVFSSCTHLFYFLAECWYSSRNNSTTTGNYSLIEKHVCCRNKMLFLFSQVWLFLQPCRRASPHQGWLCLPHFHLFK